MRRSDERKPIINQIQYDLMGNNDHGVVIINQKLG